MKPAVFDYRRAASLDEAVALLSEYGSEAKVLAGGQSLLPMMKLRLARPGVVVDLGRAVGLDYVRADGGGLAFGAMARLVELESDGVGQRCPMLAAAARHIGHPPIRHRGTVCGSLAHADPAAELPALALALDAELVAVGPGGRRVIPAERFFVTYLTTDLGPDELLAEVRFPLGGEAASSWGMSRRATAVPGRAERLEGVGGPFEAPHVTIGWGFQELSRRFGDYAMAAAATVLVTAPDGTITKARIALAGVADRAVRARAAEALLVGASGEAGRFAEAARVAVEALTPPADVHGSSAYRRHLAGVLVERAFADAWGRARPRGT
jgi:carbon-monoxide dehydrogenase medium subunit